MNQQIKKITIVSHNFENPIMEITSDEYSFRYSTPFKNTHSLQCNFEVDSPNFIKLENLCHEINLIARKIDNLCSDE